MTRFASSKASLPVLFSIVVLDLVGFGIVIPILPYFAREYGASATVLGLLLTCYSAMQFFFAPLWGRLSDRIGRRPVMLITIAGTAAALVLLGLGHSLLWLFVARLLGGIFGANISVATAYITDITDESNRTRAMGLLGASFGVGFILGPAIGGALAPYGYSVPMLFAGSLAALNWIYASFVLVEPERRQERDAPASRLALPSERLVRWLCVIYFLFSFGVNQLESVFAFFMIDRFAYDAREVAYILVFMAVIMAGIQGGAIRPLAKRFGERRLLVVGALLLCASIATVPFSPTVSILLVPLAFASIGRGIGHPAMLSLVSSAADPERRGIVLGAFQSSASLARVLSPLAAGALYDATTAGPFLLASALMLTVFVLALRLPQE